MTLYRLVIIFTILSYTNLLGFFSEESLKFIIPFKDYALITIIILFLQTNLRGKKLFKFQKDYNLKKPIISIIILTFIVVFSMLFRGVYDLFSVFKVARFFLVLLFAFIVYKQIYLEKSSTFVENIIVIVAIYYSLLSILNLVAHNFLITNMEGLKSKIYYGAWGDITDRYVIKSNNGILFIHLGFLYKLSSYLQKKEKSSLIYAMFFFIGMLFQGWRAPLFAILFSNLIFLSLNAFKTKFTKKYLQFILASALIIYVFDDVITKNIISSKFLSAYEEVTGGYEGSLVGRLSRAEVYQIPMFLDSKWIGYGFVPANSNLAKNLNHTGDGVYSLYYFDFGYLTLLNIFGIIGSLIFLYMFIKILLITYKMQTKEGLNIANKTLFLFLLALLVANYSFAALVSEIGILPLSILIGLAMGEHYLLQHKRSLNRT